MLAEDAGVIHRLLGGADGELRVAAALLPDFGIFADVGDVPVADFGRDARGEVAGVEERGVVDARLAFLRLAKAEARRCRGALRSPCRLLLHVVSCWRYPVLEDRDPRVNPDP